MKREIDGGLAGFTGLADRVMRLGFNEWDLQLDEKSIVVPRLLLLILAGKEMLLIDKRVLWMVVVRMVEHYGFGDAFGVGD